MCTATQLFRFELAFDGEPQGIGIFQSQMCKRMGDMSCVGFQGQVKSIEKLVEPS